MKAGKQRSSWKACGRGRSLPALAVAAVWLLAAALGGCAHQAKQRANVQKELTSKAATGSQAVVASYRVGCPDVLALAVPGHTDLPTPQAISPDGRIDLGKHGKLRVEGRSAPEIAFLLANHVGAAPETAQVRVAEYCSQQIFLFGQVVGWQRSVPYQGQETVLDLLRRVGGLKPGAEPRDVYVVRTHIADASRPEVFRVDVQAIVLGRDDRTNIRLLPNDQIHVGATRQAQFERIVPPWLRPAYELICHLRPKKDAAVDPPR